MSTSPSSSPLQAPLQPITPLGSKVFSHRQFVGFLLCTPFYCMLGLLIIEAALAALTTWLVIQAGQDLANEDFLIADFGWIVLAQSTSYVVGAISWVYAERAGFGAFGRYMLRFARENRSDARLFGDTHQREKVEPFLTNEAFHIFFELVYELEADLKLFFSLIFNTIVLGVAIDAGLPIVYGVVFLALLMLQYGVRKWVANTYAENQRATNSMTARTYTAWDNITSGNRYNYRVWHAGFKQRLRDALGAQIRAILAKEGVAAIGGIFSLLVIFAYLAYVAGRNVQDTALLIALAATLPRQIELSYSVHGLAAGWNDLLAIWTRMNGACNAMHAQADAKFESRIKMPELQLSYTAPGAAPSAATALSAASFEAACAMLPKLQRGVVQVRGGNGAGKSTLLAALKQRFGSIAYYWPTSTKLAFEFSAAEVAAKEEASDGEPGEAEDAAEDDDNDGATDTPSTEKSAEQSTGFSSGERQLQSLTEIVRETRAQVYLLDEWDANLDATNRAAAQRLIDELAARSLVIEISHRG
jgi:ABC-type multidrug transport system fused ATPase/permease subunit